MTNSQLMDPKRLQWACRRGMLELDLIFSEFLATVYTNLSVADQACFQKLLESPDPELLQWIMGFAEPEDPELMPGVMLVRQSLQER